MKRSILSGAAGGALLASALILVGCGSSTGEGTPQQLPEPPAPGRPAPNANDPTVNANQPSPNPDAPGTTPSGTGQVTGAGGQRGNDDHGTGGHESPNPPGTGGGVKSCNDCASLGACADSCAQFCSGQGIPANCASLAAALKGCAQQAGVQCDGTDIAVVGGACAAETSAFVRCGLSGM